METTIGVAEARQGFSELVNQVAYARKRYLIERRGKPLAALIDAEEYHRLLDLLGEAGAPSAIHGMPVRVRLDGERYCVSDEAIDLYGIGGTLVEARQDYWLAAQDYYADLSANADRLAEHMKEHLATLREVVAGAEGEKP